MGPKVAPSHAPPHSGKLLSFVLSGQLDPVLCKPGTRSLVREKGEWAEALVIPGPLMVAAEYSLQEAWPRAAPHTSVSVPAP